MADSKLSDIAYTTLTKRTISSGISTQGHSTQRTELLDSANSGAVCFVSAGLSGTAAVVSLTSMAGNPRVRGHSSRTHGAVWNGHRTSDRINEPQANELRSVSCGVTIDVQ